MYFLYAVLAALLSFLAMKWMKRRRYCMDVKRLDGKTVLITGKLIHHTEPLNQRRLSNDCLLPVFAHYIGDKIMTLALSRAHIFQEGAVFKPSHCG